MDVMRKQTAQMVYVGDRYQQIYEWRGAVNAMEEIESDETTLLTKSFRFGDTIAAAASKVLRLLHETTPLIGNCEVTSRIGPTDANTVLARTNALTITAVLDALDEGKKPHLVGGIAELVDMLRGVEDLKRCQPSTVADFFGFENWLQVVEFAKSGEGEHLLTFVNLVESRGEKQLMWALNRTVDEDRGDIVISTAHKAKGREWSKVRLMDDFLKSRPSERDSDERSKPKPHDPAELRLFYVALTRAREHLELPPKLLEILGQPVTETPLRPPSPKKEPPKPVEPAPWSPPKGWKQEPETTRVQIQPPHAVKPPPKRGRLLDWLLGR